MPRDSAKLAPWFDVLPNRSSIYLLIPVYRVRTAPCRLIKWNASKTEVVKTLAISNVATAMMHVQRQRRDKYGNKAIAVTSAGASF
jgi:hypothetical protein